MHLTIFGIIFNKAISVFSGVVSSTNPMRFATRKTWVSTAIVGCPKAQFKTTLLPEFLITFAILDLFLKSIYVKSVLLSFHIVYHQYQHLPYGKYMLQYTIYKILSNPL